MSVAIVLSCGLAVLLPAVVWWRLSRPETIREAWTYSRPGVVIGGCITGIVLLIIFGVSTAILALVYPFLWATVVLMGGGLVAIILFFVRYLRFDPRTVFESPSESDGETPRT